MPLAGFCGKRIYRRWPDGSRHGPSVSHPHDRRQACRRFIVGEFSCGCAIRDYQSHQRFGDGKIPVAPTKLHVWRLESWHLLFPDAQLWAPPQVPNQFKRLPFTGVLGDRPPAAWAADLDQLIFRGNLFVEEVYFFHKKSRTVVFGDFIQSRPITEGKPLRNFLFKLGGVLSPKGGVPGDIRLSFTNRGLARRSLEKLFSWDFDKLILAHGACVTQDAKRFVEQAFGWLRH